MRDTTDRRLRSRHRPLAIAMAFNIAVPLGSLAAFVYFTARGQPFFKHLTPRQFPVYAAFVVVPWLLLWILILAWRRRGD
jgi:cytochrome bd-type quinol oxidase subunit 2